MFCHSLDSNGIHVTVTKVPGRIFLFIVGEESEKKDPNWFSLVMFQDLINLHIVPAMTWNLIMIDLVMQYDSIVYIWMKYFFVKESGLGSAVVTVGILLDVWRLFNPIDI